MKLIFSVIALAVSLSAHARPSIEEACMNVANVAGVVGQLKLQNAPIEVSKELLLSKVGPEEKDLLIKIIEYAYKVDFATVEELMFKTNKACIASLARNEKVSRKLDGNT